MNAPQKTCAPIKAPQLVMRDPRDLAAYERNSRTHSEAQIRQVRASIDEFGFTNPILLKGDEKTIGAGHARQLAALLDPVVESVPTIALDGLSEKQWRAYVIADNRLALNAGWDDELLRSEMRQLDDEGFDMALLGFEQTELDDMLLVDPWSNDEAVPSQVSEKDQETAWRSWAAESAAQIRALAAIGPARQGITPGYALGKFLRALHDGDAYPRHCQPAFHPDLFSIPGDKISILDGLDKCANGRLSYKRLEFACAGEMKIERVLVSPLPFGGGARVALDFPAGLARDLINEFAPEGSVCDPCHGWGGRLVGFLLSSAKSYAGTDPAPSTHAGVRAISDLFSPYVEGKKIVLANDPAEEWKPGRPRAGFDLVLTSPPYFDVEKYAGGKQSRETHADYSSWRDGFYSTLIERAHGWLKRDGVFVLQVGSKTYPLLEDGKAIAKRAGFDVEEIRHSGMVNHNSDNDEDEGEVVLILRKAAK